MIAETLIVIGICTLKYLLGVTMALAFDLGLLGSILFPLIGGLIGVVLFMLAEQTFVAYWNKKFPPKPTGLKARMMEKLRKGESLILISMLTPVLLTVPVGAILSASLGFTLKKTLIYMAISFTIWATIFAVPYYYFDLDLIEMLTFWK